MNQVKKVKFNKENYEKNIILIVIIGITLLFFSCKSSTQITKEYLLGKKFAEYSFIPIIMGRKYFDFNGEKVMFIVRDKRSYGYIGTYTLENKYGKQYIKISNIEKFGTFDWQDALKDYRKDYVMVEIISPTELKIEYSGTVLELIPN